MCLNDLYDRYNTFCSYIVRHPHRRTLWRTLNRFKHQHSQSQGLQFAPFAWAAAFTTVVARAASTLPSDQCLKHHQQPLQPCRKSPGRISVVPLHFPAPEQRPWLQVFPLVVQTESFLHQSGKKVSKSSLPVLALTVRLQSYPFCSSAPRSLARPDLDKIDSWSSRSS